MEPGVLKNYIGGEWVASEASQTRDVVNPATAEVLARAPVSTAREAAEALASIAGKYTIVWAYRAGEPQPWRHYNPSASFGNDLDALEPGRGYWVRVTERCVLVIP